MPSTNLSEGPQFATEQQMTQPMKLRAAKRAKPTRALAPRPTSGCLEVMLPSTPDQPEPRSMRFILMSPESYRKTRRYAKSRGLLVAPSKDSSPETAF
jgi:hypothetical protein